MQTRPPLFILFVKRKHDPDPFGKNNHLTYALFLTSASTLPSSVCSLHHISFMSSLCFPSYLSIYMIWSSSVSCEVVRLIITVQNCDSTKLSVLQLIRHVVLSLSAAHLPPLSPPSPILPLFFLPRTDCHPLTQS